MKLKSLLLDKKMKFIFFGGKGGVGKTTFASISAIWAAKKGRKVLIVSTDPAHSLSDCFSQDLMYGEITKIQKIKNLSALEIESKFEIEKSFKHSKELDNLESIDLEGLEPLLQFQGLTPPGIDEAIAFGKLLEYLNTIDYDLIIFDTAPTGHTLRLLGLPSILSGWMGNILKLKLKFSKLFSNFKALFSKNKKTPHPQEEMLDQLELFKQSIEQLKDDLMDKNKTSFVIVMIPETMAIYETERLIGSLLEYNIHCSNIIINHIIPINKDCEFCKKRRLMQEKHIKEIKNINKQDKMNIIEVKLFPYEIRTIDILEKVSHRILG